jgi:5-methylcytosine-specific restriction endonuclease McrA
MPARTGRPWQRRKARIIRRDGGICHLCGNPGADTADHLIPWSVSHDDSDSNLAAAHGRCNRIRGDRPIDVARGDINKTTSSSSAWDW